MATQARVGRSILGRFDGDNPLVWLVYLPFFFVPWYFDLPSTPKLTAALVGIVIFLGLYVYAIGAQGKRLIFSAAACLLISFGLALTDSNWMVISVYAAAIIGELRPARSAAIALGISAAAAVAVGVALRQPLFFTASGALMMVMIGIACISRGVLADKNRALAVAQEEVKHMAAMAERERIGRDLHDLLGRSLTLIAIKADLAVKLAQRAPDRAETEMREVAGAAREALAEVRAAVAGMTGASLARELASARAALAAAGIECHVEGEFDALERGASAVLAMTLREAITNVIRHSAARNCRISLARHAGGLELLVIDDGDGTLLQEGGGLGGLRSRLAAAGGVLSVAGNAAGTRLMAQMPASLST